MMSDIHESVQLYKVEMQGLVMIREFCTIHKSLLAYDCKIYERVSIKRSRIGRSVDINAGTYIENAFIWDDVQIAPNCNIVGVTHKFSCHGINHEDYFNQITLETGVWVGAGVTILPGVTVGMHSVIAAGSIVNQDIPAHHLYIGVPLNNNFRLSEII